MWDTRVQTAPVSFHKLARNGRETGSLRTETRRDSVWNRISPTYDVQLNQVIGP